MLFKRLYDDSLAQASYLIGCQRTGDTIVVDPNRDVAKYVEAARVEGARITHVAETHIHADFVSGARELARQTGAQLLLSGEGPAEWQYGFAAADGARLLRDGDRITVGDVLLDVLHTPGHTPEHLSFLVTDTEGASEPMGLLSGDFIFVGDVGRPDLLERAAGEAGSADALARALFHSLQRVRDLPDWLQLWPGHGAGSACGKALGAVPQSTLGYERRFGWAFGISDENEFVAAALDGQTAPPRYFARMKCINRDGPPPPPGGRAPIQLDAAELRRRRDQGATVVDTRPTAAFAKGHLRGAIAIPAGNSVIRWGGTLLDAERDIVLIAADADSAARTALQLALIGFDRVVGYGTTEAAEAAARAEGMVTVPRVTPRSLAEQMDDEEVLVVDVRAPHEWSNGHLPGAPNIPLGSLPERLAEIPRDTQVVLHCQGGTRSMIAASVLQAAGFENVADLEGGYEGWVRSGEQVHRAATEAGPH